MNSVKFTCEVVTPMFLAGADGSTPELRPPSIKGALRFWWRAMNGNMDLDQLRKEETKIFGGGGEDARRSRLNIRVSNSILKEGAGLPEENISMPLRKQYDEDGVIHGVNLFKYLAFGADKRKYIDVNTVFKVTFTYDDRISLNEDIVWPFYALAFFGGLGAKSRNGFGSFRIIECSDPSVLLMNDPEDFLGSISSKFSSVLPLAYTAFSRECKLFKTDSLKGSWDKCLAVIGAAYAIEKRRLEYANHYDKRAYVATPIVQSNVRWHKERNAKQYFLRVIKKDNRYEGWVLFLPYKHRYDTDANAYKDATEKLNAGILTHDLSLIDVIS